MAYDALSGKFILFGGTGNSGGLNETWSYDAVANTWTDLSPTAPPSARYGAVMAYDSTSDTFILFGGYGNSGYLDDTWSYDAVTNTWTNLSPTTSPSARYIAAMVYDSTSDTFILFGGAGNSGYLDDTWSYDAGTNSWTNVSPAFSPSARGGASVAYDSNDGRMLVFGGEANSGNLNDTWSYDSAANRWTQLPPVIPSPRQNAAVSYDTSNGKLILFGGSTQGVNLNDTWSYDAAKNIWTNLNPIAPPSARDGASMAYDPVSGKLILFGGQDNSGYLNDTWSYDAGTNTWANISPSLSPPARYGATMVYDSITNQSILFGGDGNDDRLNDTWLYVGATNMWTQVHPVPSPREGHAMVYDSITNRVILFGGDGNNGDLNDTWAFTITSNTLSPTILSSDSTTFPVGVFSSFIVVTTGFPPASITEEGTLPPGITFVDNGNGTATLSGTPVQGSAGSYPITISATNGVSPAATQTFTLNVNQTGGNNNVATLALEIVYACGKKSRVNQPVELIAQVNPLTATGIVTFYNGEKILGSAPLVRGIANLVTSFANPKPHAISAAYSGDANYAPARSFVKMLAVKEVLPPQDVEAFQKTQKNDFKMTYVNVIQWQAPNGGLPVVAYRIYRNKKLNKPIGEVSSRQQLEFKDLKRNPCKVYKYYIISVDACGNTSKPVFVKIKGDRYCPHKVHIPCEPAC